MTAADVRGFGFMTMFLPSVALAGLAFCCLLPTDAATVALYDGTGDVVKAGASNTILTADGVSTLLSALLQTEASPAAPVASRLVHLSRHVNDIPAACPACLSLWQERSPVGSFVAD